MMLAVFESGGKQYVAEPGAILKLELVDAEVGDILPAGNVLMVKSGNNTQFNPQSCTITMEVLEQKRDKKIIIFKKKRRKNYRRKLGHRQDVTIVQIKNIEIN